MIKKMKKSFTLATILAVSIVLLVILLTINLLTINQNVANADNALQRMVLINNVNDSLPLDPNKETPRKDNKNLGRAFDIFLSKNGTIIKTTIFKNDFMAIGSSEDLAKIAFDSESDKGFANEFRFLKIDNGDDIRVIYLDYSFEKESEKNFMIISLIVYLSAIVLTTVAVNIIINPLLKPLRVAYQKQREFITNASHELKTPLTIISTDIQLIEQEVGESQWTASVSNQVERLKSLSDDLVVLSRMEETDLKENMKMIKLSELVSDIAVGFEPALNAKNVSLKMSVDDDIVLNGDYDAIEQTISVIVSNALKYSIDHSEVKIELYRKSKGIVFKCVNSCEPIEEGTHDEYFERFYRGDKSRNSSNGGFGIGLAIAKSVIEEHKGTISATSTDGNNLVIKIIFRK